MDNLPDWRYMPTVSLTGDKIPPQKGGVQYDTKLHLLVRLPFWNSVEWGVPYHCD